MEPLIFDLRVHNAKVLLEELVLSLKDIGVIEAILTLEEIKVKK